MNNSNHSATIFTLLCITIALCSCSRRAGWQLVWQDDFNAQGIDYTVWSHTDRGTADWANTQSKDPRCYEMRGGCLVLKGIVNDNLDADTAHYLTGGIWTKGKHAFDCGRIEVRARLQGAQGAWPAIWLLPFDTEKNRWPNGGEIDIMERLNHDTIAYQTVHSYYTLNLKQDNNPPHYTTAPIKPNDFNVYGVDIMPDSLVFHVNGKRTFAYPRIVTDKPGQFPFHIPQYLLIDMQLGGSWVGPVDPSQLPIEMEIDWVRHYQLKK